MRISVIGCGYLGAVHAACMTALGHDVVGVDVDERKIARLADAEAPFYEPGLPELLASAAPTGRLRWTTDLAEAAGATVHFVCVGTPQRPDGPGADLTAVDGAISSLLPVLRAGDVVVGKSTVPVGTADRLSRLVASAGAALVWNPEFLREGFAVQDTLHPDRLVYGLPIGPDGVVTEAGEKAQALLDEVYSVPLSQGVPKVATDYATAELVKVAANAFLATKISYINAMAEVCEATGADVKDLADAIGHDARIGRRFLDAGLGFGGGCLPKDIRAFSARAEEIGAGRSVAFLREVDAVNLRRRARVVELVDELCGGSVVGRRVAVLGVTFKPNTDDVRDSPSLDVARRLEALGAVVTATDPQGAGNAQAIAPGLRWAGSAPEAARDADVVVLGTEWAEYRDLDPAGLAGVVANPRVVDRRNVLDADHWTAAGWTYRGLGRRG